MSSFKNMVNKAMQEECAISILGMVSCQKSNDGFATFDNVGQVIREIEITIRQTHYRELYGMVLLLDKLTTESSLE